MSNISISNDERLPDERLPDERLDLLRDVLACLSDGLIELNESGVVLSVDVGAETLLARQDTELIGRELIEIFPMDGARSVFAEALSPEFEGAGSIELELDLGLESSLRLLLVRPEGAPHTLVSLRRSLDPGGQFQRHAEGKRLESLGLFAGGVAHDFNNLLLSVIGNTTLVKRDVPFDSPLQDRLDQIEQAANKASELTDQILAFAGRSSFHAEEVDLENLLRRALADDLRMITREADVRLEIERQPLTVQADPGQLRRLLANLVGNSLEALRDSSGRVTVRAGEADVDAMALRLYYLGDQVAPGRYAFIEVVDNGYGMEAETQLHVFEPFFSTKFAGRGLGLPAVLGIVRAHGGTLNIYSEPERGTRVRVLLPLETGARPRGVRPEAAAPDRGIVVIADDEPNVRRVTTAMLEQAGYRVIETSDGREAVDAVLRHPEQIKAVLLDLTMPTMTGEEALRTLRERGVSVPVILSSGLVDVDLLERFDASDPAQIRTLQKPFRRAELLDLLREIAA